MTLPRLNIKWRITLLAGLCILVVAASLLGTSAIQAVSADRAMSASSKTFLEHSADLRLEALVTQQAQTIERYFTSTYEYGALIAMQVVTAKAQLNDRHYSNTNIRQDLVKQITASLSTRPELLSTYVVLDANAFDDADAAFAGSPSKGSNEVGRLSFYISQSSSNHIDYQAIDESELANTTPGPAGSPYNQWITCPKQTARACILEPFPYTDPATGKQSLISSMSLPIIDQGKVIGAVGVDIRLSDLQLLAEGAHRELYEGAGHATILSSQGLIAGSSANAEQLTQHIRSIDASKGDLLLEWSKQGATSIHHYRNKRIIVHPFRPLPSSDYWSVILEIPDTALLAPVRELQSQVSLHRQSALRTALAIGTLVALSGLVFILITATGVTRQILRVAALLGDICRGDGDLTRRVEYGREDELGTLCKEFNAFLDKLQPTVAQISRTASATLETADRAADVARKTDQELKRQFAEIDLLATASTEMSANACAVAQSAANAAGAANEVQQATESSLGAVHDLVDAMEEIAQKMSASMSDVDQLADRSDQIGSVLTVIRSIAEQTNLLALNAAIEAARAGDAGRGFAVVADEVRNLAKRTQQSVDTIRQVIEELQHGTRMVITTMRQGHEFTQLKAGKVGSAIAALTGMSNSVNTISHMNTQIACAAEQQSSVAEEMSRNIAAVRDLSNVISLQATDSSGVSLDLNKLAMSQRTLTSQFKVQP
ncbi:methyl-accepting chemotaxis protein [Pantoea sp. Ap-967]|uniref:methyl-accepting chemotaxis protein n=1 Tax=Pantoea sp. Ap-967 TaxID=2608362 RepID=UPI0014211165|nr:methyl-accepting chemotaxis protein [Pantoea sp. Ap-967]